MDTNRLNPIRENRFCCKFRRPSPASTRFQNSPLVPRRAVVCSTLIIAALLPTALAAGANWHALASRARQQLDLFQPIDSQALINNRASAQRGLADVQEFLQQLEPVERASWRQKLQLDQLAETLSLAQPNPDQMRSLSVRFYQSDAGLEDQPFVNLRAALDRYESSLRIPRSPELARAEYTRRITAIADLLEQETNQPDAVTLDGHLAWLSAANQVPAFVEALRRDFAHPNVLLEASRATIASQLSGINEDVDQTEFVSTTILGAEISGEARFQASVTPAIASDTSQAEVEIQISGHVSAPNNVVVRRPVVLYTSSTADVQARKRIYWKDMRLEARPTTVEAVTCSQINDVQMLRRVERGGRWPNPAGRLITRLARTRAERQKADAEREASWQTQERIAEHINEYVGEKLEEWNGQVKRSLVAPLTRLGVLPKIQARTSDSHLFLEIKKTGAGGLAAPQLPTRGPSDALLAVHIHETALTNFLTPSAAGARWTDRQFADIQKQLLGDNSYEFRIGLHPRWEVVLDSQRPLTVSIGDQSVRFEFNMRELTLAGQSYPYPFCVAARYRIQPTTTVMRLDRLNELELTWTGSAAQQPTGGDLEHLSQFVRQTFSGFFMQEAYTDGLETPAGGDWSAVSGLKLRHVDLEPGWLCLAFDR